MARREGRERTAYLVSMAVLLVLLARTCICEEHYRQALYCREGTTEYPALADSLRAREERLVGRPHTDSDRLSEYPIHPRFWARYNKGIDK